MEQEGLLSECSIHECNSKPLKIISEIFGRHPAKNSSADLQKAIILAITNFWRTTLTENCV